MKNDQLISQAYVVIDEQISVSLKYYIFSGETQNNETLYGLMIEQIGEPFLASRSKAFLKSKAEAVKMALTYAEEFVFPCSLEDLVYDYMS